MAVDVIDCEEFGEIQVAISSLIENRELRLDPRISGRGYLNVSLSRGQVVFRADRYVGLIPISDRLSIRVRPRADIANLSYMLAQSGVIPSAVQEFSRGYLPRFESGQGTEEIYYRSLLSAIERVISRGLMKSYIQVADPPAWRGRYLVSETVRRWSAPSEVIHPVSWSEDHFGWNERWQGSGTSRKRSSPSCGR